VNTARPLPRYGAFNERARSRPCFCQLHHHLGTTFAIVRAGEASRVSLGAAMSQGPRLVNSVSLNGGPS